MIYVALTLGALLLGAIWYIIRLRRELIICEAYEDLQDLAHNYDHAVKALYQVLHGPMGVAGGVDKWYNDLWWVAGLEEKGGPGD